MPEAVCSIRGCGEPHHAKGWCFHHYRRAWRTGDPQANKPKGAYGADRETRTCSKCGETKPAEAFGKRNGGRWYKSWCRPCESAARLEYARRDPRSPEERSLAYWRRAIKREYGITEADYDRMLAEQGGRCAICAATECGGGRARFCIDHDHETGAVRGLLCNRCNAAIGRMEDSADLLARAADYLRSRAR